MHKAAPLSHTIEFTSGVRTIIKPRSGGRGGTDTKTPTAVTTLRTDTFNTTQAEDSYNFIGKY